MAQEITDDKQPHKKFAIQRMEETLYWATFLASRQKWNEKNGFLAPSGQIFLHALNGKLFVRLLIIGYFLCHFTKISTLSPHNE